MKNATQSISKDTENDNSSICNDKPFLYNQNNNIPLDNLPAYGFNISNSNHPIPPLGNGCPLANANEFSGELIVYTCIAVPTGTLTSSIQFHSNPTSPPSFTISCNTNGQNNNFDIYRVHFRIFSVPIDLSQIKLHLAEYILNSEEVKTSRGTVLTVQHPTSET